MGNDSDLASVRPLTANNILPSIDKSLINIFEKMIEQIHSSFHVLDTNTQITKIVMTIEIMKLDRYSG